MPNTGPLHTSSNALYLRKVVGCVATLTLIPLWMSGAFGEGFSFGVTIAFLTALILVTLCASAQRLEGVLRIVFVISAASLAIVVADYLLRVVGGKSVYYRAHTEFLRKDTQYSALSRYARNVNSTRATFGDLAAISGVPSHRVARNETFRTDAFGFRNSPDALMPPYKAVVVGDSFGMGLGVSQDEHWVALLNKAGYSAYNFSIPATCAAHGAARLSLELDRLPLASGATIIAPVYAGNDLEECTESADAILAQGPQSATGSFITLVQDYRARSPLRQLGMRLVYRFLFSDPVIEVAAVPSQGDVLFYKPHDKVGRDSLSAQTAVESHPNFRNLVDGLLRMQSLATSHNARFVVVIIPSKEEVYGWLRRDVSPWQGADSTSGMALAMRSVCEAHHLLCLDLKPALLVYAQDAFKNGELLWWRDDSHWNQAGHRAAEQIIDEFLQPR